MTAKPSVSGQWAEQQKLWQRKEQKKDQQKSPPQMQQGNATDQDTKRDRGPEAEKKNSAE
jgi:hypothetical protein